MPVTSRKMKIIGVICGIICVGTSTTLCLKAYMDASLSSAGMYKIRREEIPVAIVENQTESLPGRSSGTEDGNGAQKDADTDGSLPDIGFALAGMAKILEKNLPEADSGSGDEIIVNRQTDEVLFTTAAEETFLTDPLSEAEQYMEYLGTIERQVNQIYNDMEGASIKEMQEAQDYAYRIWDDELNRIYPVLKRSLSEAEGEKLKLKELQWIKDRDAKAQRDSASAVSESRRLLIYSRSLTDSTRERTYILAEWYFQAEIRE